MNVDTQPLVEAGKSAVQTLVDSAARTLKGVEQLAALNVQAVKTTLTEALELSQASLAAKSPEEWLKLHSQALQAAPTKAASYLRQAREIVDQTIAQQRAAAEAQLADVQAKFLEALQALLKNAPGSEGALQLVKAAVDNANSAFESVQKAGQQVADAVDANVLKFTETAAAAVAKD